MFLGQWAGGRFQNPLPVVSRCSLPLWSPGAVSRPRAVASVVARRGRPSWSHVLFARRGLASWSPVVGARRGRPSWSPVVVARLVRPSWSRVVVSRRGRPSWSPVVVARRGRPSPVLVLRPWSPVVVARRGPRRGRQYGLPQGLSQKLFGVFCRQVCNVSLFSSPFGGSAVARMPCVIVTVSRKKFFFNVTGQRWHGNTSCHEVGCGTTPTVDCGVSPA